MTPIEGSDRRRTWLIVGAIVLAAACLRLFALDEQPFWLDEAHTADFTTLTVGELWSFDSPYDTVNTPGYILVMKLWAQVSRSDWWFRALSALAGIATVPVVYLVGARVSSRRAGYVAAAFVAVSGFHVRYSQEARTYTLVTLCAAIALLSVTQLVTQPEGDRATIVRPSWRPIRAPGPSGRRAVTWTDLAWIGYGLAVGVSLHLHSTGIGIPLAANSAVGIWWLTQRPKPTSFARNWIGAHLVAALVYSPWIPGLITQLHLVQTTFWVPEPTIASLTRDTAVVFDAYGAELWRGLSSMTFHIMVLVAVAIVVWFGTRRLALGPRLLIVAFVIVQPMFEALFSLRAPVFLSRTLIWMILGTAVATGVVMTDRSPRLAKIAAVSLVAVQVVGTIGYHAGYEKTAWDRAAAIVADNAGQNDIVLVLAGNTTVAFEHYFDRYDLEIPVISLPWRIPDRSSSGSVLTGDDIARITDLADDHATTWLVLNSVANIQNGVELAPALERASAHHAVHRFTDVQVFEFD